MTFISVINSVVTFMSSQREHSAYKYHTFKKERAFQEQKNDHKICVTVIVEMPPTIMMHSLSVTVEYVALLIIPLY